MADNTYLKDELAKQGLTRGRALGARLQAGMRVATLGTSLVGLGVFASVAGNQFGLSQRDWLNWARFYGMGRIEQTNWFDTTAYAGWEPNNGAAGTSRNWQGLNMGVPGQTLDQIIARLPFISANYLDLFDIIIIDGGTNEVAAVAKEDISAKRKQIAEYFNERGKLVVMLPILARSVASWSVASNTRKKAQWINQDFLEYARRRPNIFVYNWNKSWVDGSNANGEPKAGYSPDGIHFNMPGGDAVGLDLISWLDRLGIPPGQPRIVSQEDKFDLTDNPKGNFLANPFWLGSTAYTNTGVTGNIATGCIAARTSGSGTMTLSKEVRADGRGENQVLTIAPGGAANADEAYYFQPNDATHQSASEWIDGSMEIEINEADNISQVSLAIWDSTVGFKSHDMCRLESGEANVIAAVWPARARKGRLQPPPQLLSSGSTLARFRLTVTLRGPATVNPVIKIGPSDMRRCGDPRPAYPLVVPVA